MAQSYQFADAQGMRTLVESVKGLGMETCATLGMLTAEQPRELAPAGLDYYNHNLDTSPEYYGEIVTSRRYQDRLDTLANVRVAGIDDCCCGIVGMGETRQDRVGLRRQLANLPEHPESVPSTTWCGWKVRRCTGRNRWRRWNWCAPSPGRAS